MVLLSEFSFYLLECMAVYALVFQFFKIKLSRQMEWLFNGILLFLLCAMAYNTWPGPGSDLARYFQILEEMQSMTWRDIFLFGYYKTTVLTNVFMGLVAHSGNYKLLPFVSTLFITCNLLYLMGLEQKRVGLVHSTKLTYLVVVFGVVALLYMITCVRHAWMVSVFAIAVYRDLILHKRNWVTILLYVATGLIHTAGLVLILIRLCTLLKGKFKWLIMCWMLLAPQLQHLADFGGLFGEAVLKFSEYQVIGAEGLDIRWRLTQLAFLLVMTLVWFYLHKTTRNKSYMNFYATLLFFTFGAVFVPHLFFRLIDVVAWTSLPVLNEFFQTKSSRQTLPIKCLLAFICAGLFCYHGVLIKTCVVFM